MKSTAFLLIIVIAKLFFRGFSKKLTKKTESTIQESIKQMVEEDRKIATDSDMQAAVTKGAVEAYHHNGLPVYYDALALCNKYKETLFQK